MPDYSRSSMGHPTPPCDIPLALEKVGSVYQEALVERAETQTFCRIVATRGRRGVKGTQWRDLSGLASPT